MSSWNINEDVNKIFYDNLKDLDYNLEYAEDRCSQVIKIINHINKDGVLDDFLSSDGYRKKQVKTKSSFLAESEPLSKVLMRYSYFIDFPKHNNESNKLKNEENKLHTSSLYKEKKNKRDIVLTDNVEELNGNIIDVDFQKPFSRRTHNVKLMPKQEITAKDRKEYSELNDYMVFLEEINKILGFVAGIKNEKRIKKHNRIVSEYGDNYLVMLKRVREELMKELPLIKDRIRGTIYLKKIDKGAPVYSLDCDTGYVNENGDYIEVSENKLELNDQKHILAIMDTYSEIKEAIWDSPGSDLWIVLHEFENLVEISDLENYEKDILTYKIDKLNGEDICKIINDKYDVDLSESNLSRIYNEVIPRKIANTYDVVYEDWLYTYKKKGKYKKCSKCGEIKLLNERNFYKEPKGKDGFKNSCKECV